LQAQDPLVLRFTKLRESGISKDEAWKVMAVEILADAGIVAPESLVENPAPGRAESIQISIDEAKLVRPIRIEPEDDDRIQRLVARAKGEASVSRRDSPNMSSIMRQALRLGLDELERQHYQK
jgi:hypothetical protein